MKITEASMASITPGERGETWETDDKLTGFAVRARRLAGGRIQRTFAVKYQHRVGGVRKTVKAFIGDWRDPWTEADARVEAKRLLTSRDKGEAVVSSAKRAAGARLVSDLVAEFERVHLVRKKRVTAVEYARILKKEILPVFGGRRVAEVSRADVRDWHQTFRVTPYQGNRNLAVLSRLFGYAIEREWRTDNPAGQIGKFAEKRRDAWLNEDDLPKFLTELNRREEPHAELLRFLTVSGWRVREAIGLRWDMVDLRKMTASLADTKSGEQVRALSSDAATLIDRQEHRIGFVFSSRKGMEPVGYKQVRETLEDVCKAAGVTRITAHALRHTAATYAATAGASVFELMRAFGWKSAAMPSLYVEAADSLSRQGAEKAAGAINVFRKPAADVKVLNDAKR